MESKVSKDEEKCSAQCSSQADRVTSLQRRKCHTCCEDAQSIDVPVTFKQNRSQKCTACPDTCFKTVVPTEPSCVFMNECQPCELYTCVTDEDNLAHRYLKCGGISAYFTQKKQTMFGDGGTFTVYTHTQCSGSHVYNELKSNLEKKFERLYEGMAEVGKPVVLNHIFTELYITESESGEISNEHEVRQIEMQSRRTSKKDKPINCNDIFRPSSEQNKPLRTVLTKGVAGIGKTVSVQKFILDWAEEKANQDVHLIFPLPFRELNLIKDQNLSLKDLLHLFMDTKQIEIAQDEGKYLFIFDGLDECRLSLDFHSSVRVCDVNESASVDVLLTNLIRGNLLPSALIWITSRPAAADLIPSECVDRVTEVRGFSDSQKEEYFRKRISDESLACRIISHLKASRSLYIMCHIPVFCWISATVLERLLSEAETGEIPKTLTQMYTHFLLTQTNIKNQKDYEKKVKDEDIIFKLGKLAFEQLLRGNLIFYEEDLQECGIDVAEASVYSGLCTQIFREVFGLPQRNVYCFVHLSIQEHLAAAYVLFSYSLKNKDVFNEYQTSKNTGQLPTHSSASNIYERAVDEALQSKNGHLDLFLRFLVGLSLESNQKLFQSLLTQTGEKVQNKEEITQYVKKKIREKLSPEKFINLFHCLNELGDHSLQTEIQDYLNTGTIKSSVLSPSQWSALVFVLLTSEKLEEFELKKYIRNEFNQINISQDQVLLNLLPVIKMTRSAQMGCCSLTEKCCTDLASVLSSESSCIRELNLNRNPLQNSGVKLLSAGLENPHCKLEALSLWYCGITDEGCAALSSALSTNHHLKDLDLSENNLENSGVKLLSDGLQNPHCELHTLQLRMCNIGDEGCTYLASALIANPSHLKKLDLSINVLEDSGVERLCEGLHNHLCSLEVLLLNDCGITDNGCAALSDVLTSNPSHLQVLHLFENNVTDTGLDLLTTLRDDPHNKLEELGYD